MINIKTYLDCNFKPLDPGISIENDDGSYSIHGSWMFSIRNSNILCFIHDKIITINVFIDGRSEVKNKIFNLSNEHHYSDIIEFINTYYEFIESTS